MFLVTSKSLIDVELGEIIMRFQDENVVFNVFKVMCHHNENPHCYRVDVVDDVGGGMSQKESPLLPIKYIMVNYIDTLAKGRDKQVKKYECQVKTFHSEKVPR